jgi:serine phosphatase RsbU (regulator of sigma subunit)
MALATRMAERLQAEHRAAHEIELARQVQAKLLPQAGPRLRSLEYAGRCVQARAVGGDYYDFLDAGEGRVGLVLADVSGKGLAAALLVASLHASLRSQSPRDGDLVSQLRTVNRLLFEATETNRYATLFLGRFDDADRRLRYANCGHNPPLVLRHGGGLERLAPTAMVVGLVAEWTSETAEIRLEPGDILAVYSDGITEATDRRGEEFGEARLVRVIQANRDRDVRSLLDLVFEEVRVFSEGEQADDQTMVVARVL